MMARVRGVIAASIASGSMLKVTGSMSMNTGRPPALWMAPAVAKKVNGVVITSSPGLSSKALSGSRSASVPLAHPTANFVAARLATASSSWATSGPMMKPWRSTTVATAAMTSSLMARCWATRSSIGTFTDTSVVREQPAA
jgi:hypothetical protein